MMTVLYGCTDELDGVPGQTRPSDVICFTASLSGSRSASLSRSTSGRLEINQEEWLVETENANDYSRGNPLTLLSGSAGVIGYVYDTWANTVTPHSDLYNEEYVFDGDELTAEENDVRWSTLNKSNAKFYVYAPYNLSGGILSQITQGGNPTLTYVVNDTPSNQHDLIVASWEGLTSYKQSIPLSFEHALTAVKFKVGFECTVTKLEVKGIYNTGTYTFGDGWIVATSSTKTYEISSLTDEANTLLMIPQTLASNAEVVLHYTKEGAEKTITSSLANKVWQAGKMITYTIHETEAPTTIYFDLAAGNVSISPGENKVIGFVYEKGKTEPVEKTYTHQGGNNYYIYQSTGTKRTAENPTGVMDGETVILPVYDRVMYGTQFWSEYITNNPSVENVIEAWDDIDGSGGKAVRKVGREHTDKYIDVSGDLTCNLIIDNLYSRYHHRSRGRTSGGLGFKPTGNSSILKINILGDNRFGCVHYAGQKDGNQLVFEGTGSLTVADADFNTGKEISEDASKYIGGDGYTSNHWCSAIGNSDSGDGCYGIIINSGVIFAGTTAAENCSAIGGGGNGIGDVTIRGGVVTAVATTTGTAIGGGIGFKATGGKGKVIIEGGNIYAYNWNNKWNIPSSAIGGAGSSDGNGAEGTVKIKGGFVYAYSETGTAIGGGSSATKVGGNAVVEITGGMVIAKSGAGTGIGGGTGSYTSGSGNGGSAEITIDKNPIIRTGSVGGGKTGENPGGKIGAAEVLIKKYSTADIQAQFVMAAGTASGGTNSFTMEGGTIRNSYVDDEEYIHIQKKGGAVYLEDGTFTMTGGTIKNCSAEQGGAVYIERKSTEPMGEEDFNFKMEGGDIHSCFATGTFDDSDNLILPGYGGAVCLNGGQVLMTGGKISNNYSDNGDGGAVYISNGNFFMKNGLPEISGNSALRGNGGGVFVASAGAAVKVDLQKGKIINNTANNYGGGICVDMFVDDEETGYAAEVTVGKNGQGVTETDADPVISGNMSMMSGGGLYVRGTNANIQINSGMIDKNDVSAYVKNENVANEGGEVVLNAGKVTHVVVTFDGNKGQTVGTNPVTSYIQNIVTNTNSKLVGNLFSRSGYTFKCWNTRADGLGLDYIDEAVMNISGSITLYAKWMEQ